MWTVQFWKQATELAIRQGAGALIAMWTVGQGFNVLHVDWSGALGVTAGAMVLSLLGSIVASGVGQPGTATFTRTRATPAGPAPEGGRQYGGRIGGDEPPRPGAGTRF